MVKVKIGQRSFNLPGNRLARMAIGVALIAGGIAGFLPVLGFWMIPLGLIVLSVDIPLVRRRRREWTVRLGNWLKRHYPKLAARLGFNGNGSVRKARCRTGS